MIDGFEWPAGTKPVIRTTLVGDLMVVDEVEDAPLLKIRGYNGVDPMAFFGAQSRRDAQMVALLRALSAIVKRQGGELRLSREDALYDGVGVCLMEHDGDEVVFRYFDGTQEAEAIAAAKAAKERYDAELAAATAGNPASEAPATAAAPSIPAADGVLPGILRTHAEFRGHHSDCAVHNEPALPAGPCDCALAAAPEAGERK